MTTESTMPQRISLLITSATDVKGEATIQITDEQGGSFYRFTPAEARRLAMGILETVAQAADDARIMAFFDRHGLSAAQADAIIQDLRLYRDEQDAASMTAELSVI